MEYLILIAIFVLFIDELWDFFDLGNYFTKNRKHKKCKWGCRCDEEDE